MGAAFPASTEVKSKGKLPSAKVLKLIVDNAARRAEKDVPDGR